MKQRDSHADTVRHLGIPLENKPIRRRILEVSINPGDDKETIITLYDTRQVYGCCVKLCANRTVYRQTNRFDSHH